MINCTVLVLSQMVRKCGNPLIGLEKTRHQGYSIATWAESVREPNTLEINRLQRPAPVFSDARR